MWFGLLTGFTLAVCLLAVLTHYIGVAFGTYVSYLKYFGAAYICYLAYKIARFGNAGKGKEQDCNFLSGMVVQLTNAKIILFDLSCYSAFVLPYSERFIDLLPVTALLLLAGPGANLVWLLAGGAIKPFVSRYAGTVSIVMATALLACAVMMIFI